MQTMEEAAALVGSGDNVESLTDWVDHGRADDTHGRQNVGTVESAIAYLEGGAEVHMPVLRAVVGVKGIDAVAGRGDIKHIVRAAGNIDSGNIQRLRIYLIVDFYFKQHAELIHVYVCRREN